MSTSRFTLLVVVGFIFLILANSVFTVRQWELAIKLQLGEIVRSDFEPGLHFKLPFVNNIKRFDSRILTLDAEPQRFLTVEKKDVIVDSYVKWRITDVGQYFRATGGSQTRARQLVSEKVNSSLRDEFAKRTIQEVISGERGKVMQLLTKDADSKAEEFGISVIDVRVKRIDLPEQVSNSVHRRMRAERERVARELRSEGFEEAEKIKADADRQRAEIVADAYREAEKIKGKGDAVATETYARAYQQDEEFYRLTRSLSAYREIFYGQGDVMLLEPDSEFFRFFKDGVKRQP